MAMILIVDDDAPSRELLVGILGFIGYGGHQVREAADGEEGLAVMSSESPDLIIADLLMPTMDGFEFVRQLRDIPRFARTPVVFYSANYLASEVRQLAEACGVHHIITKPAEPDQILAVIREVLGSLHRPTPPPQLQPFRQEHVRLLNTKLAQLAAQSVPRLDLLIDLGLRLMSERDSEKLMSYLSSSARKMVGAKYAAVAMLDDDDKPLRYQYPAGFNTTVTDSLTEGPCTTVPDVHSKEKATRLRDLSGAPEEVGLPAKHPPVRSLLCAPITSPERVYGWLCLADKIGASGFNDEDEGLTQILAAQVGRIHENNLLYAAARSQAQSPGG